MSVPLSTTIPPDLLFERSCREVVTLPDGGCRCTTNIHRHQIRCCCVGMDEMRHIPQNFHSKLTALLLYNAGVVRIDGGDFERYADLEELFIDSAYDLTSVNGSAFSVLERLRKMRISNCPKLTDWHSSHSPSTALLRNNPRLETLIVSDNAIRELPMMEMAQQSQNLFAMEVINFSNNRIRTIHSGHMRNIAARVVRLDGNRLESIEAEAFPSCEFMRLGLARNGKLREVDRNTFVGISELHHLDLSGSAISQLPVKGLKNIHRLTLQNVKNLKKLPSILAFNHLERVDFTYPSHCCLFKYATRDYVRNGESPYQEHYNEIQQRACMGRQHPTKHGFPTELHSRVGRNAGINPLNLSEWYHAMQMGDEGMEAWMDGSESVSGEDYRTVEGEEEELPAYTGSELGRIVVLRRCNRTAVDNFYLKVMCTPQPDALNPCEDIVGFKALRVLIWVIWPMAIVGNGVVWAVLCTVWRRGMRLHYFFMFNLSVADFLTGVNPTVGYKESGLVVANSNNSGLYLAILAIADLHTAHEYYNYAVDWQTGWICSLAGFISVFASQLSVLSMLLIAVEIFYSTKYSFYGRRMSISFAITATAACYLYCLFMASLPLLGVSSYQRSSICLPLTLNNVWDQAYLVTVLLLALTAFGAMAWNYVAINFLFRRNKTTAPTREEDRQILMRTMALIGTDMLCLVPTLFFGLTASMGLPLITLTQAKICLVLFYPINSCANPILYVFLTKIGKDAKRRATPVLDVISPRNLSSMLQSITPQSTVGRSTQQSNLISPTHKFFYASHPASPTFSSYQGGEGGETGTSGGGGRRSIPKLFQSLFAAFPSPSSATSLEAQQHTVFPLLEPPGRLFFEPKFSEKLY